MNSKMSAWSIVLLTLSFASWVRCDLRHYITYKSFPTALHECGEYFEMVNNTLDHYISYGYPCTPEVKRLIHCALVNLGAWNDKTGVRKNVIQYLFKPNKNDSEYEERTQCCLDKIRKDGYDQNHLAYETFSCYYQQYGRLVKDKVLVPLEEIQYLQSLTFMAKILVITPEKLKQFVRGDYLNDPLFKKALYIGSLRQGAYSLEKGFLLDVGYVQYNIPEMIAPSTRQCVADVSTKHKGVNHEELMYQLYLHCLHSLLEPHLMAYFEAVLNEHPCGVKTSY